MYTGYSGLRLKNEMTGVQKSTETPDSNWVTQCHSRNNNDAEICFVSYLWYQWRDSSNWIIAGQKKDHTPNLYTNTVGPTVLYNSPVSSWCNLFGIISMGYWWCPLLRSPMLQPSTNLPSMADRMLKRIKAELTSELFFLSLEAWVRKCKERSIPFTRHFCTQFAYGEASALLDLFASKLLGWKHCRHLSFKIQRRCILENIAPLLHQLL